MTELFNTQNQCRINSFEGAMLCGSWVSQINLSNKFGDVTCRESYSFFSDGRAVWDYIEDDAPGQCEHYQYQVNDDRLEMAVVDRPGVVRAQFKIFSNDSQTILALRFEDESDVILLKQKSTN